MAETAAEVEAFREALMGNAAPADPNQLFSAEWIEKAALNSVSFDRAVARTKGAQYQAAQESGAATEFYIGENPGFIFVASNAEVVKEMLGKHIIGVPLEMRDVIVHMGAPLFVLDYSNQCVLGIFKAESPVSENIDPKAFSWNGGPSMLPIQLRVSVALNAPVIYLQDPEMREVFRDTGFRQNIDVKQTRALAQLFASRAGPAPGVMRGMPAPSTGPVTHSTLYRPPFKNVAEVPIDIQGDLATIKKRVLGVNAATILHIVEELGTKNTIRIRMRGVGSGYQEGPQAQEIQEPLHFNVSAETEELLHAVVARVRAQGVSLDDLAAVNGEDNKGGASASPPSWPISASVNWGRRTSSAGMPPAGLSTA
jgi:hypothetical protein